MKKSKFASFTLVLFSTLFFVKLLFSSELVNFRTDATQVRTQLTLQFNSKIDYEINRIDSTSFKLEIQPVDSALSSHTWKIKPNSIVDSLHHSLSTKQLVITIYLRTANVNIEHSFKQPFGFDHGTATDKQNENIYTLLVNITSKDTTAVATTSLDSASIATTGLAGINKLNELRNSKIPDLYERYQRKAQNLSKKNQARAKKTKVSLLFLIIGVFLAVDAIVLVFYLANRSRAKNPTVDSKNSPRKKRVTRRNSGVDFAEIMKKSLNSAEQPSPSQDVRVTPLKKEASADSADRINAMIERLSNAMRTSYNSKLGKDLHAIVSDLETLVNSKQISKEVNPEQLIGKDGLDFLQKMKELNLN